jgi:transcriptional regulator with XRE-family HTH domain
MSPPPTRAQLGRAVRRLRVSRRLSLEALAFAAEMHPTYLSNIERGHGNPTWSKLGGLAKALDMPISKIAAMAEDEAICPACECCGQTLPSSPPGPPASHDPTSAPAGQAR